MQQPQVPADQVTTVNGVPIMQVGPTPVPTPPVASPTPAPSPPEVSVDRTLVPQAPANVPMSAYYQPPVPQGATPPKGGGSLVMTLLALAAAAIFVFLTFSTCSVLFDSNGPDYHHEEVGGSNGMDDPAGSADEGEPDGGIPDLNDLVPPVVVPNAGIGDPDDGELHRYWDDSVSYSFTEERMSLSETRANETYGENATCEFSIAYPQLEGDLEHLDQINALIRESALGYYERLYANPDPDMVEIVMAAADGAPVVVSDKADYAITFNSDGIISIAWSHDLMFGSVFAEYLRLETLNIDLETGETYELDDVLELNETQAKAWVYNLSRFSTGRDASELFGRDAMVQSILGEGEMGNRTDAVVFIDADGTPNLGVSFWYGNDEGIVRGWWDLTLTDELLEGSKKNSRFWELVPEAATVTPVLDGPTTKSQAMRGAAFAQGEYNCP